MSFAATTIAVGICLETSSAWLGPDNTAYDIPGNSSSIISSNEYKVALSKPFAHITIGWFVIYGLYCLIILRTNLDGVTCKITSVSCNVVSKSV